MRKAIYFLLPALLLAGCAERMEFAEPAATETGAVAVVTPETTMAEVRTRGLSAAVYNEVVDAWIVPQADPYALENFQRAYDNLAARKSKQRLTKAQAAEFTPAKKLRPTHLALKIYPKNEEEQWRVERMDDVQVAYIPFDQVQLTQEEVAKLPQARTAKSAANTFAEKSPYTVTYDYTDVTDGGPTGPVTYQLPILYTVWPVSKPLPEDLEYVVDYEVLLPYTIWNSSLSAEAMQILWSDALALSSGYSVRTAAPLAVLDDIPVHGNVYTYDDIVGKDVPMTNLRVRYQRGSFIYDTSTDVYGHFDINIPNSGQMVTGTVIFTYQDLNGRWKITAGGTTPYSVSKSAAFISDFMNESLIATIGLPVGTYQENVIHRAVNYFYNVQNVFEKHTPYGGTTIIANANNGRPYYNWGGPINIFHRSGGDNGFIIGDTMHELGHLIHYEHDSNHYRNTNDFLQEAFACYVGWYAGEEYYKSIGWIKSIVEDVTHYGRQTWWENATSNEIYSPLFVDLTDDFNQKDYYSTSSFPNDNIKNVPTFVIWNIITNCQTGPQCKLRLQDYVGTGMGKYYTVDIYNEWIIGFGNWLD